MVPNIYCAKISWCQKFTVSKYHVAHMSWCQNYWCPKFTVPKYYGAGNFWFLKYVVKVYVTQVLHIQPHYHDCTLTTNRTLLTKMKTAVHIFNTVIQKSLHKIHSYRQQKTSQSQLFTWNSWFHPTLKHSTPTHFTHDITHQIQTLNTKTHTHTHNTCTINWKTFVNTWSLHKHQ